jgi:flagellar biosynthesis anti-sigma factor FlgM
MRIDLTNSGPQQAENAGTRRTAPNAPAAKPAADPANATVAIDRAQFSFDPAHIQALTAQALSAPEVRQEKVASLTQAVEKGQYSLDAAKIAGAIVSAYSSGPAL